MATPVTAKFTVSKADRIALKNLYAHIKSPAKEQIRDAIKCRDHIKYGHKIDELIALMALFIKFICKPQDITILKKSFDLTQDDIDHLTQGVAIDDESSSKPATLTIDAEQPDLFGDLPTSETTDSGDADDAYTIAIVEEVRNTQETAKKKAILKKFTTTLQGFAPMAQGAGYNAFQYMTEKNSTVNIENEIMTISRPHSSTNIKVTITNYESKIANWRPSTKKLLEFAVIKLTGQNHFPAGYLTTPAGEIDTKKDNPNINRVVTFSLVDWQAQQGAPLTKDTQDEIRERVKADAKTILNTTLEWEEVSKRTIEERKKAAQAGLAKKQRRHWKGVNLVTAAEVNDSFITIAFSPEMASYLLNSYITQYPTGLLTIDDRNPNAYAIGRKLAENYYNNANKRHNRNGILSVISILECTNLPTTEEVKEKGNGDYKRRIIDPFIKALKAAEKAISLQWRFCNAGGDDLHPDQHPDRNIAAFDSAYIIYTLPEKTDADKSKGTEDKTTEKTEK